MHNNREDIYLPVLNQLLSKYFMNKSTRNTLRLVSILIVLALVLMELNLIPPIVNYRFWFMVLAYGLTIITYK